MTTRDYVAKQLIELTLLEGRGDRWQVLSRDSSDWMEIGPPPPDSLEPAAGFEAIKPSHEFFPFPHLLVAFVSDNVDQTTLGAAQARLAARRPMRPLRIIRFAAESLAADTALALLDQHEVLYHLLPASLLIPDKRDGDSLFPEEVNSVMRLMPLAGRLGRLCELKIVAPKSASSAASWSYRSWLTGHERPAILEVLPGSDSPESFFGLIRLQLEGNETSHSLKWRSQLMQLRWIE